MVLWAILCSRQKIWHVLLLLKQIEVHSHFVKKNFYIFSLQEMFVDFFSQEFLPQRKSYTDAQGDMHMMFIAVTYGNQELGTTYMSFIKEWIRKTWKHMIEYDAMVRRNELDFHRAVWTDLVNKVVQEIKRMQLIAQFHVCKLRNTRKYYKIFSRTNTYMER